MNPAEFVAKWLPVQLPERAASQEHFIDLCRLLGQPTPAEHDATGAEYTFEKGVAVTGPASAKAKGQRGFADVWWKGKFGWEYKTKDKYRDLADAYRQLCQYREALDNPPLLVVCDIARRVTKAMFTRLGRQRRPLLSARQICRLAVAPSPPTASQDEAYPKPISSGLCVSAPGHGGRSRQQACSIPA